MLLTPLYVGSVLLPLAIVVAVATNSVLPVLARASGGGGTVAAAAPLLVWIAVVVVLSLPRPEGDVLLPGGKAGQLAVSYGMVLAGVLAGTVAIALGGRRRVISR